MEYILLGGAIFNFIGGVNIILLFAKLSSEQKANPPDYAQYRLFTAGAAFTFSGIYFYLFLNPHYAMPFLLFGIFLKSWAFLVSFLAYKWYGLPARGPLGFGAFGVCNLIFAILFVVYLLV
jgi:hypothetical protein